MFHEKIQSTIGLIEDVIDNKQKETDNTAIAKRNSIFFDTLDKLTPSITSYILAKKNFGFDLQVNTASLLADIVKYSKKTFDECRAVNPSQFKQRAESFFDAIT